MSGVERSEGPGVPRAPLAHRSTVALAVLFAGMIGLSPPALAAALDTAYVLDDFVRVDWPDPELWVVHPGQGWRTSACQFVSGSRSLRAFGGTGSAERPCGPTGGAGSAGESAIDLRLDLRSAATANRLDLEFELWLGLPAAGAGETTGALFIELFVPDGSGFERITVFGATRPSGAWTRPRRRLDLTAMVDVTDADHVYDLRGDIWTLRLRAVPSDGPVPGDVFIDDLTLIWEPDLSVPTPTVRPLSSPTPTSSPTRTVEPTPSPTVESTPSSEPGPRLYLPWLSKPPAVIEPTPSPKPGPRLYLPWLSKPAVVIEPSPEPSPDVSPPPGTATSETPTGEPSATPAARRYFPSVRRSASDSAYPGP